MTNKQKAQAVLKSLQTGDTEPQKYINPHKYIQHNLSSTDGLDGFKQLVAYSSKNNTTVDTVRTFEDGDYVFLHTSYLFIGMPIIGFDIFRFEDGLIVEHWDNLQDTPSKNNPSGHSMTDGVHEARNPQDAAQNKQTAQNFVNQILMNAEYDNIQPFFNGDHYIQHNPNIGDGVDTFVSNQEKAESNGSLILHTDLHKILADGDFVLTVSEAKNNSIDRAYYNLFRLEKGKIVEHWDVIQDIPPKSEWKNNNGKFNFPGDLQGTIPYLFVGKKFKFTIGDSSNYYILNYTSDTSLTWSDTNGNLEVETVDITKLKPNQYLIFWKEKSGNNVMHIEEYNEDYTAGTVYASVVAPDGTVSRFQGNLTLTQ